jgi:hypothetical protein
MFGPTLLLASPMLARRVPHYRPRLRFAGNRDGQEVGLKGSTVLSFAAN